MFFKTKLIILTLLILSSLGLVSHVQAAQYSFTQTNWSGGQTASAATHASNQTGWNQYSAKNTSLTAGTSLTLDPSAYQKSFTSDTDFSGGTNSNTQVTGSGNAATVGLARQVSQIASGGNYSCALKTDGTVWCWGQNSAGQIGDGTIGTDRLNPVQVLGAGGAGYLMGINQIAVGQYNTCALKSDGTVYCWGQNTYGQIGDNTSGTNRLAPVQVLGAGGSGNLTGVSQISVGYANTCAVKTDGTAYCWGSDGHGQIGDNTSGTNRLTPVQVLGVGGVGNLTGISQITTGGYHSCALTNSNTVYCWGYNINGQIGDNTTGTDRLTPVQVKGVGGSGNLTSVNQIVTGYLHTCAKKIDGTAYCWGYNYYGQIGDNTSGIDRLTPVQVLDVGGSGNLTGVSQITTGYYHTCALKTDNTVYCWGYGGEGEIGDNTSGTNRLIPVQVLGVGGSGNLISVDQITAGTNNSCALKTDGTVYCWGSNSNGQIGDNTTGTNRLTPVQVTYILGVGTLSNISQISSGVSYACALKSDGTVYCWGDDTYGQIGDNTSGANRLTPMQVRGVGGSGYLTGVSQIVEGAYHTCALKTDNTVYCWGQNAYGQIGDNTSGTNRLTPVQVLGVGGSGYLTGVSQITTGYYHTCALKTDNTVYCWGYGGEGEIGDNTTSTNHLTPVQVLGVGGSGYLTGVSQISAGAFYTCALKTDGTVYCWGYNNTGQIGDNTTGTNRLTPVQVKGVGGSGNLAGVSQITGGYQHTCALKTDGTVYCWGYNSNGQIGDNTSGTNRLTPMQVLGVGGSGNLTGVNQVILGAYHTCALKTGGTVYCWGYNGNGQIGDNTVTQHLTPVQVVDVGGGSNLTGVSQIASGQQYVCAMKTDKTVYCWGYNNAGQIGDNTIGTNRLAPVPVSGMSIFIQIVAGYYHACALKSDNTVYCWGQNAYGQIGDNTSGTNRLTPMQVRGVGGSGYLTGVSQIVAGAYHTCALKTDNTVYCWGYGGEGEIGDNTTSTNHLTPVQVLGVGGSGYLTGVSQISAGAWHTCAVKTDSTIYCWGYNNTGQIGDNTTGTNRLTPVQVKGVGGSGNLAGVSQITGGYQHTCALKTDGTVYCWGNNGEGEIGDNTSGTNRLTPMQVLGVGASGYLTSVSQISAGAWHTCAVKTDGTAYCWGLDNYGQIGDNVIGPVRLTPVQVLGVGGSGNLTGVNRIIGGLSHTCALKNDNTLYCWGYNSNGQIGDNTSGTNRSTPVQVRGVGGTGNLTGVVKFSAGYYHTCALKSDGTAYCWGRNDYGQLGNNSIVQSLAPIKTNAFLNMGVLSYSTPGTYTSAVTNLTNTKTFSTLTYNITTPAGTTLTLDIGAGNTATPDGSWTWLTNIGNGGNASSLSGNQYIQYRANLAATDTSATPFLSDITFNYNGSATLTSSPYNIQTTTTKLTKVQWTSTLPVGTIVKFQLGTSVDGTTWTWCGPDDGVTGICNSSTYFTDNAGSQAVDDSQKDQSNDQYIAYKAFLFSAGQDTPTLTAISLFYNIPTTAYLSVGQSATDLSNNGSSQSCSVGGNCTVFITSGVATFNFAQTGNIGVGDDVLVNGVHYYISGKVSQLAWNVVTATGATPTNIGSTTLTSIKRVYTSLNSAVSGASTLLGTTDLTAAAVVLNIPCYYDTGADTTAVTVSGYTTSATNYIKIYTPNNTTTEANNSQRHSGKWDDGRYRLEVSNETFVLTEASSYAQIIGLQIKALGKVSTTSTNTGIILYNNITSAMISSNIIRATYPTSYTDNGSIFQTSGVVTWGNVLSGYIFNNIIYGFHSVAGAGSGIQGNWDTIYVYNNSVYNCDTGYSVKWSAFNAKNNIAQNCTDGYNGIFVSGSDYSISDLASDTTGGAHDKQATVAFANVAGNDFHLANSDTAAKGKGANLSADTNLPFNTDIDGQQRGTYWSIGADEPYGTSAQSSGPVNTNLGINSGLVGYWSFDGDDLNGTTVKDLSGNGNNGTNNGAVPTLGKRGQALSFNGTSQYANMGNATSVQLSLDGSVSAWVKTTGSGSYKCIVAKQGNYGFFNNDGIFGIYDWGALAFRSSGVTINDGEWHFVTMTFQDGVSNGTVLYVDGVEKLITTMTISSQSNNLLVGYGNATGQYLNGSIDEVRVYNRVLSAAEVGQLYQTGTMKIVPGLGTAKIK